jgi:hypothetical protein
LGRFGEGISETCFYDLAISKSIFEKMLADCGKRWKTLGKKDLFRLKRNLLKISMQRFPHFPQGRLCERVEKRGCSGTCVFGFDLTRIFGVAFFTLSTAIFAQRK